jgi:hypothetical protein
MKHALLLFLLMEFFLSGYSQSSLPAKSSNPIRERNEIFARQTAEYAPLSIISPPYCDLGSPKKWYWISTDIAPHFIIGGGRMRWPVHITPRYRIRWMHDDPKKGDTSLSVRTPSFMPYIKIFIPLGKNPGERAGSIHFASIASGHHSNGQDGNEFQDSTTLNTYNGNFSTNYLEAAIHTRFRKKHVFRSERKHSYLSDFFGSLGYEHHYLTAPPLKSTYGRQRLNLVLGWIRKSSGKDGSSDKMSPESKGNEKSRCVLNGTVILGQRKLHLSRAERRINFDLSYFKALLNKQRLYVFLSGGYYGSDTYNIYYQNRYWYLRTGIALGFYVLPPGKE